MISDKYRRIISKKLIKIEDLRYKIHLLCIADIMDEGYSKIDHIYLLTKETNNLKAQIERLYIKQS